MILSEASDRWVLGGRVAIEPSAGKGDYATFKSYQPCHDVCAEGVPHSDIR
jgi:hypothetical protein